MTREKVTRGLSAAERAQLQEKINCAKKKLLRQTDPRASHVDETARTAHKRPDKRRTKPL